MTFNLTLSILNLRKICDGERVTFHSSIKISTPIKKDTSAHLQTQSTPDHKCLILVITSTGRVPVPHKMHSLGWVNIQHLCI